jgi:uncharacterized protein involved in type VI secretion and phage assembly
MAATIVGTIQEIVRTELRGLRVAELGVVQAVQPHRGADDGDNYGCDVRLKNSGLVLPRVPVATGHIGTAAIPNAGDLVLLAFEQGDVNQPIVIGRLYNDADRPPLNDSDEVVFRLPLAADDDKSVLGAVRNHQTASPARELVVQMPPKLALRLTDGTVQAVAGHSELTVDEPDGGRGSVTAVSGRTRITVNQDGDVTIEAAGSISLSATGDVTIEGQNVSIKGQLDVSIEAQMKASVTGPMGATVDGGLSATVKGATVAVQGLTSFSP